MNCLVYFTRVLRASGLAALLATAVGGAASAQNNVVASRASEPLVYRSADRTAAVQPSSPMAASAWKALLVGGNHLIDGYNNAANDIAARLRQHGVQRVAVLQSMGPTSDDSVPTARRREMRKAMKSLGTAANDVCLFFITSHANERGIYLSAERGYLSARDLSSMIDAECGERPTVLILSGCGTGSFITSSLTGDNRIILTASARGKVSYGATTTDRYVNFDRCVIKAMDAGARTWRDVFERTRLCVDERERALGVAASEPQAWFGSQVGQLALPGRS
ncbi:MAG TPA: C13 family peptidase [Vineibacter sp.]|nr:C13 family peptidase [Vineibacter sp.]